MPAPLTPRALAVALDRLSHDRYWRRELKGAWRRVGNMGARFARAEMRARGDKRLAAAARAVRSAPLANAASVAISNTAAVPFALASTYGVSRHTGWYAAPQYDASTGEQHPPHVGNDWEPATRGQGPRGMNDGLAPPHTDELVDVVADELMGVIVRAFPAGTVR